MPAFGAAIDAGANASPAGKLQLSVNFLAVEGLCFFVSIRSRELSLDLLDLEKHDCLLSLISMVVVVENGIEEKP